jgi:predicted CXXCH cytochrome family protein
MTDGPATARDRPRGGARPLRGAAVGASLACAVVMAMANGCSREPGPPANPTVKPTGESTSVYEQAPEANPLAVRIKPAAQPAPKPTNPMPATATCVTSQCHASYAAATRLHGPLSEGRCDACHGDDTGKHVFPLKRQGNALCTFCHVVAGTQPHQHAAVADPGCLACHKPHAGHDKFLLTKNTVGELCISCHNLPLKRYAHDPFAKEQCTVCHFPHQSTTKGLLRGGEGRDHCLTCHPGVRQKLALQPFGGHEPTLQVCTSCHNPHSTDFPRLLNASIHDNCVSCHKEQDEKIRLAHVQHGVIYDEKSCANCHDPHGSAFDHLLADSEEHVCLRCHNRAIQTKDGRTLANMKPILAEPYLHGPVKGGYCSGCHNAHGAKYANLLREPFPDRFYADFKVKDYGLCFMCHSPDLLQLEHTTTLTDFRNGDENLHYVHVHRDEKGRTCKACHAVHGSGLPDHIAETVAFEGSKWEMPIRFQKTPDGGSCAPGCHKPLSYGRDKPFTYPLVIAPAQAGGAAAPDQGGNASAPAPPAPPTLNVGGRKEVVPIHPAKEQP